MINPPIGPAQLRRRLVGRRTAVAERWQRAIRAWEHQQGRTPTPVVALTASAMPEDVRQALEAGCDAHMAKPHVAKPVKKHVLLAAIERYAREAQERPPAGAVVA